MFSSDDDLRYVYREQNRFGDALIDSSSILFGEFSVCFFFRFASTKFIRKVLGKGWKWHTNIELHLKMILNYRNGLIRANSDAMEWYFVSFISFSPYIRYNKYYFFFFLREWEIGTGWKDAHKSCVTECQSMRIQCVWVEHWTCEYYYIWGNNFS